MQKNKTYDHKKPEKVYSLGYVVVVHGGAFGSAVL
jgi:hypothetical protein